MSFDLGTGLTDEQEMEVSKAARSAGILRERRGPYSGIEWADAAENLPGSTALILAILANHAAKEIVGMAIVMFPIKPIAVQKSFQFGDDEGISIE